MTDNKILPLLKNIYPLSLFDDKDYQAIVNYCQQIRVAKNAPILEAGKSWPGLYFIVEGQVRFVVKVSGRSVDYNKLHASQHFGHLTSDAVNNFSVYGAAPSTTLLYLPKKYFQIYVTMHPQVEQLIREYQRQEAIKEFLIRTPVFSYVPTQHLHTLVTSLKKQKLQPHEILIRQGDEAKEAYILEEGRLTVHIDEHPNQVVRTLIPGDLVGEIALLKNAKRTSNVIAQTESSVYVLPREEFFKLFKEEGQLSKSVNQLVQDRLGTTHTDLKAKSHVKDYKTWLKDRLGLFPVVLQEKPQDSGAACLAMVCRYYGKSVDLDWIRFKITNNQLEASISDLIQAAEKIGIMPLGVLSSYEHLMNSCLPAIVGWKGGHWAVVYQVTDNKVSMVDPAHGAQKISKESFINTWVYFTLYLKPSERFFGK
ncbi:MAG: cyclic nucleotide-binding domain-containing protein [Pseudomonadota bacterium]